MFKKGYSLGIVFMAAGITLLLNGVCFSANDTLRVPIDTEATDKRVAELGSLEAKNVFLKIGFSNERVLRIAKAVDQMDIGPEDDVLIVGQGGTIYLPMACAVRAKTVDIVQPDKDGNIDQYENLSDKFKHIRISEQGTLQASLVNKINIESYRGRVENIELPERHYSYVFIPAVLDYLNRFKAGKKEGFVNAILPVLKDDAVVLISTLSGDTENTVKQEAYFFQGYAEKHGYSIIQTRVLESVHILGGSPTIELKLNLKTKDKTRSDMETPTGPIGNPARNLQSL